MNNKADAIRLYSAEVCPFAHRTRLLLAEKGAAYELSEIDLKNMPDWFRDISPYGKVPLLEVGEDRIWESAVINEYLEEILPEPPFMPADASGRARARIWVDYANNYFVPCFYKLLLEQDVDRQEELASRLRERLGHMEAVGFGDDNPGPWWLGAQFTLVDLSFYPFFERFCVLEHYRQVSLTEYPRLSGWLQAMGQRDSVQAHQLTPDLYLRRYSEYATGSAAGKTAQEMRDA